MEMDIWHFSGMVALLRRQQHLAVICWTLWRLRRLETWQRMPRFTPLWCQVQLLHQPSMQDPRVFVSHLPALEHAVVNFNVASCMRLFAWWTLVQSGALFASEIIVGFVLLMSLSTVLSWCLHLFDLRRLARTMPVPVLRSPRGCAPLVVASRTGWS